MDTDFGRIEPKKHREFTRTGYRNGELDNRIGVRIARVLTDALCGKGIPYTEVRDIVDAELLNTSEYLEEGDWLEFPDGTTFTLTFKPQKDW